MTEDGVSDRHEIDDIDEDRDARVAYVLDRALALSAELKTTVHELSEMLRSSNEEGGSDHSE